MVTIKGGAPKRSTPTTSEQAKIGQDALSGAQTIKGAKTEAAALDNDPAAQFDGTLKGKGRQQMQVPNAGRVRQSTRASRQGLNLLGRAQRVFSKTTAMTMLSVATLVPGLAKAQGAPVNLDGHAPKTEQMAPRNVLNLQATAMTDTLQLSFPSQVEASQVNFVFKSYDDLRRGEVTFEVSVSPAMAHRR